MTKLKEQYQKRMPLVGKKLLAFPWDNADAYALWLAQTYFFVRYSTRFLLLVGGNLAPSENLLHSRFIAHAQEEKGHEKMLLNDLHALGRNINEFEEIGATSGFYQSQFFWIEHRHPLSFFGYIALLEGMAAEFGDKIYPLIHKAYNGKAATFAKVHTQEDPDHIDKAFQAVAELSEDVELLVVENFNVSVKLYEAMLVGISQEASYSKKAAA